MDSVTMLDGYLRKAVNPKNTDLDISAIDQFCLLLKNDPSLMTVAPSLLAGKIQSGNLKEAMLALDALEECMETCGREFRSEINKFRFLNELIKLVSKKFDGDKTPREVSERILNILLTWTNKYENCGKIQEAYNLLKTQGIEHHPQQNVVVKSNPKNENRRSIDEKEFSKLRQLIHSSRQEDRDKANLLIQNFYRDDERRAQMRNRRFAELEKVAENTKLLDEMLSQYRVGETSEDDMAIIEEIFKSCEGMHPTIIRLAGETQLSEDMLEKIFEVNDNLTQVLDKYRQIILKTPTADQASPSTSTSSAVLSKQLGSYSPNINVPDPLDSLFDVSTIPSTSEPTQNPLDDLSEIFSSSISSDCVNAVSHSTTSSSSIANIDTILTPLVVSSDSSANSNPLGPSATNRPKQFTDIQNLLPKNMNGHTNNNAMNVSKNDDANKKSSITNTKSKNHESSSAGKVIPDLDFLVNGMKSTLLSQSSVKSVSDEEASASNDTASIDVAASDDDEKVLATPTVETPLSLPLTSLDQLRSEEPKLKSLAEIVIDLDNIQPSREPSRTVLNDRDGLQITLNFACDHPRPDVTVIVISTINQGRVEIPSFHFDASVRKPCKLRLLPASGSCLPGTKPFRPPADGITQVLLLANPTEEPVDLTCILTYCVGNDPDPIKESVVMKDVPFIRE